jgi:hypothetical protein
MVGVGMLGADLHGVQGEMKLHPQESAVHPQLG